MDTVNISVLAVMIVVVCRHCSAQSPVCSPTPPAGLTVPNIINTEEHIFKDSKYNNSCAKFCLSLHDQLYYRSERKDWWS